MITITNLQVISTSLVSYRNLQKIVLQYKSSVTCHLFLTVKEKGNTNASVIVNKMPVAIIGGIGETDILLPLQNSSFEAEWILSDKQGNIITSVIFEWTLPRKWNLYIMTSSHTDIGLHNSQYIQRHNTLRFIDEAAKLCDETETNDEINRYKYMIEGTWFFNNYGMDKGDAAAERIVKNYINKGKMGMCATVAGNHIQTYGTEELCRSAYEKRRLSDKWNVKSKTMAMVDNNGLPWSMVPVYADAGYENIIFLPNHWNPLWTTVFKGDFTKHRYIWYPSAAGGGARADFRLESNLPMVFNWENKYGKKLTVWCASHYCDGFGFYCMPSRHPFPNTDMNLIIADLEEKVWKNFKLIEERYPFDIWFTSSYYDDMEPNNYLLTQIEAWNKKWQWPKVQLLGDPDNIFEQLRDRFSNDIPTLSGDITGGWYQHPLTVTDFMSDKFEADRQLPTAEKWATIAALIDTNYTYPAEDFRRAWDYLLFNDEHSYGTSSYGGRRVHETWMQHRDWVEKAYETAENEKTLALNTIASQIHAKEPSVAVFNATALAREEYLETEDKRYAKVKVPPFGYTLIPESAFVCNNLIEELPNDSPIIENNFYKLTFSENGSVSSVYDKELRRDILYTDDKYGAGEIIYTKDNHKSFSVPEKAQYKVINSDNYIKVISKTHITALGAEIKNTLILYKSEKRIDITNEIYHAKDMINDDRYYRYLYTAFPFKVNNSKRLCHLQGTVMEYAKDVTGHGTDVYMAANEWCCAENDDFGVALMMKDTHIVEFDHIHPDKTDFGDAGEGSQIFVYVANDWLQRHIPGGSYLNFCLRYSITSYKNNYKDAKIPEKAERFMNPLDLIRIPAQTGKLKAAEYSFLKLPENMRFVCLKRADDGNGMIARFCGEKSVNNFDFGIPSELSTIDERECKETTQTEFITYRLGKNNVAIKERVKIPAAIEKGTPAPIGTVYTGLITKPRAAAGENSGQLYLLWGANNEDDFSHYKLYRSERQGFVPDESTFIADILPEEYVVARYEDLNLKKHTAYYYRVCAVNKQGICGKMSDEFCGITREE